MKICIKCDIEKELEFFHKRSDAKDGYRNDCKECRNKVSKQYSENNIEKVRIIKDRYYQRYKEEVIERSVKWQMDNPEASKKRNLKYRNKDSVKLRLREKYLNNKEEYSIKSKEYKSKNKDKINEAHRLKYKTDPMYRLKSSLRNIISKSISRNGYQKNSKTETILGCSFDEFKSHIESKFEHWMSWDNYGRYNGELNYGWDIDHMIPASSSKTEEELIKLNNYKNLQPLCSKINRDIKRDNIWNYSTLT